MYKVMKKKNEKEKKGETKPKLYHSVLKLLRVKMKNKSVYRIGRLSYSYFEHNGTLH
jgi:hypothetical protein